MKALLFLLLFSQLLAASETEFLIQLSPEQPGQELDQATQLKARLALKHRLDSSTFLPGELTTTLESRFEKQQIRLSFRPALSR